MNREPPLAEDVAAAQAYEELFVPALFQQWTRRMLRTAKLAPGQKVLDVACGTGILAREAARAVGSSGHAVGLDIAPGMLEIAKRLAPTIEWCTGSAEELPFPDGSFDAVVSQFGLMFFSDRKAALNEMLRVLLPGGRLTVAVWDALERMPAFTDEATLLDRLAGVNAGNALRAPFTLGDRTALANLAGETQVGAAQVTTCAGTAHFPSIRAWVEADLKGWLPVMGVALEQEKIEQVLSEAQDALRPYTTQDGHVVFKVSAHILSGFKS